MDIAKFIFNIVFLIYGILGLMGIIPVKGVLATYMIVYVAMYYDVLKISRKAVVGKEDEAGKTEKN